MRTLVDVRAERGPDGRTVLTRARSAPPLTARRTLDGLTLVASAGGPLGGDVLELRVHVAPGADLAVGSAGAMLVQPSRAAAAARVELHVRVDAGGRLQWRPAPTIVAAGARLSSVVAIDLAEDAALTLQEVVVLGRAGEAGGVVESGVTVEHAGRALLRQENLWNDPSRPSSGPAVLAGHRVVGTLLLVGPQARGGGAVLDRRTARMRLADDALLVTSLGDSVVDVCAALRRHEPADGARNGR